METDVDAWTKRNMSIYDNSVDNVLDVEIKTAH